MEKCHEVLIGVLLMVACRLVRQQDNLAIYLRRRVLKDAGIPPEMDVILLWGLLYTLAYGLVLNPPAYQWYFTPFSLFLAIPIAYLAAAVMGAILRRFPALRGAFVTAALAALAGLAALLHWTISPEVYTAKYRAYTAAADWMNADGAPGDSVGTVEIGVIRYHFELGDVIDGLGLVTPGVVDRIAQGDFDWYVREFEPDYLVTRSPPRFLLEDMVTEAWFAEIYEHGTYIEAGYMNVTIFRRRAEPE